MAYTSSLIFGLCFNISTMTKIAPSKKELVDTEDVSLYPPKHHGPRLNGISQSVSNVHERR